MLKPFLSYYGGKYRIAPAYPAPRYQTLVEPFAGSAGYAVRYPGCRVWLYDKFHAVVGAWDYLIRSKESEIRALPAAVECVDDLPVPQEAKWLIGFWLNHGSRRPCHYPSAWAKIRPESFWGPQIRERLASQVRHIRHWRVAVASFEQVPNRRATWFVDPPYDNPSGRLYKYGRLDHAALGAWCRARRGQVVVCENVGANWLPFEPFCNARTTPGKFSKKVSREAIWTQG